MCDLQRQDTESVPELLTEGKGRLDTATVVPVTFSCCFLSVILSAL